MKMPVALFFALLLCRHPTPLDAQATGTNTFPALTINGRTLTNATVSSVTPEYATIFYDGGAGQFPFSNLPDSLQRQYSYDPAKAAKFLEGEKARKDALRAKLAPMYAAQQAALQKAKSQANIAQAFESYIGESSNDVMDTISWRTRRNFMIMPAESPADLGLGVSAISIGFEAAAPIANHLPRTVTLTLNVFLESHLDIIDNRQFTITWDGSRTNLPHLKKTSDSTSEDYGSWAFEVPLSFDDFKAIAFAKSVRAQFDWSPSNSRSQFEFPNDNREALRAFVNYFDARTKTATNGTRPMP